MTDAELFCDVEHAAFRKGLLDGPSLIGDDLERPTLLDVLDRLLDRGVVVSGELRVSVAGVDLLFVGLKLFLSSIDRMEDARAKMQAKAAGVARPERPDEREQAS